MLCYPNIGYFKDTCWLVCPLLYETRNRQDQRLDSNPHCNTVTDPLSSSDHEITN